MTLDPTIDAKAFVLDEDDVAAILNLTKGQVRQNRGPENGRWAYGPRRAIRWSLLGMEELRREKDGAEFQTGFNMSRVNALAKIADAKPSLPSGTAILEVLGCRFENRHVLHCVDPESLPLMGGLYRAPLVCHVADAYLFLPGMRILARRRNGRQAHVWDFAGNPDRPHDGPALPRGVGRW